MYLITVESTFRATHSVPQRDGSFETPHSHDWLVQALFRSPDLDANGMVVDFLEASETLNRVVEPLRDTDLNTNPVLDGMIPTAEVVARHIHDGLRRAGLRSIFRVSVVEAPGCTAAFESEEST